MSEHRRFFVDPWDVEDGVVTITGGTAHQIGRVLRLRLGDIICLLDGQGCEHEAEITSISKAEVTARILQTFRCGAEPEIELTLAMCLPKADKLDQIVQKCTELGIFEIVVVHSERTVAKPDDAKILGKIARWKRIAAEAAEQSGRGRVPEIRGIVRYSDLPGEIEKYPLALVAWEDESNTMMKGVLQKNADVKKLMLIIGPEGGLAKEEVELVRSAGAICVSLGKRVLRCETAAIAGCAAIMYELEGEL